MDLRHLTHAELMALLDLEGIAWEPCGHTIRVLDVDKLAGIAETTRRTTIVEGDVPVARRKSEEATALDNQSLAERMQEQAGKLADEVRKEWRRTR